MNFRSPMTTATPLLALAMIALTTLPARGQDATLQSLADRLNRQEQELRALQQNVYRGDGSGAEGSAVGVGGAAYTPQIERRLSQLEEQLQVLTGQLEEAQYRLRRFNDDLDRRLGDLEYRMAGLEGGGGPGPTQGAPLTSGTNDQPYLTEPQPGLGEVAAEPDLDPTSASTRVEQDANADQYETMGVLGTIDNEAAAPPPAGTARAEELDADTDTPQDSQVVAARSPSNGDGDARSTYEAAYQLLRQADYDQATVALQTFIDQYPQHELSGNAHYWLGETYFVRSAYDQAAVAFARGYKSFPNGEKAPDNLLKLGMTFVAMGKNPEACATFSKLEADHPEISGVTRERLAYQQQKAQCP